MGKSASLLFRISFHLIDISDDVWQNINVWVSVLSQSLVIFPIIRCCSSPSTFTRAFCNTDSFFDSLFDPKYFWDSLYSSATFRICTFTEQSLLLKYWPFSPQSFLAMWTIFLSGLSLLSDPLSAPAAFPRRTNMICPVFCYWYWFTPVGWKLFRKIFSSPTLFGYSDFLRIFFNYLIPLRIPCIISILYN